MPLSPPVLFALAITVIALVLLVVFNRRRDRAWRAFQLARARSGVPPCPMTLRCMRCPGRAEDQRLLERGRDVIAEGSILASPQIALVMREREALRTLHHWVPQRGAPGRDHPAQAAGLTTWFACAHCPVWVPRLPAGEQADTASGEMEDHADLRVTFYGRRAS